MGIWNDLKVMSQVFIYLEISFWFIQPIWYCQLKRIIQKKTGYIFRRHFLILFQVPDENYDEFEGVVEVFIYLKISFWFIQPKANNMILSTEIRLNFFYKLQGQEHIQHCVSGNLMQFVINTRWNNWYSNVI